MRVALAGWGGDGGGIWTVGCVGLGQQLRAVTPEDLAEDQPVASRDGRRVLVTDGRIDNRPELAAELGLSPSARRLPDSAFILAAYERWGADCGRHLTGSFSFAVWDGEPRAHTGRPVAIRGQAGALSPGSGLRGICLGAAGSVRGSGYSARAVPGERGRLPGPGPERTGDEPLPKYPQPGARPRADRGQPGMPDPRILAAPASAHAATGQRPGIRRGVQRAVRPGGGRQPAQPAPGGRAHERRAGLDSGGGYRGTAARPAR